MNQGLEEANKQINFLRRITEARLLPKPDDVRSQRFLSSKIDSFSGNVVGGSPGCRIIHRSDIKIVGHPPQPRGVAI